MATRLQRIRNFQSQDFYPALVIRPITILIMLVVADWKVLTPNRLTTVANVCKLAAAWLILVPEHRVLAIVALQLGLLFDHLDGTLARYRGTFTKLGSFYDKVSDIITWPLIVMAAAWEAFRETGDALLIVLGAASVLALCIRGYVKWLYTAETERVRWFEAAADPAAAIAKRTAPIVIALPPERDAAAWAKWLAMRVAAVFAFEEMDLWLWLGVALAVHRLDWMMWFLALTQVPLMLAMAVYRAILLARADRELAAYAARRAPRAVMFDLDGTLIDTMGGFADLAAEIIARRHGLDHTEARRRYLETSGIPFRQQLELIAPGHAENQASSDEFEQRKRAVADAAEMDATTKQGLVALRSRGLRLVVSSNGAQHFVDDFARKAALPFDLALGFDPALQLAKGAPHVAATRAALGVEPRDLVFCGDSLADAELAAACGIRFIGRTGTFTRADFLRRDPHAVTVDSIAELPALIGVHP